MLDFSPIQILIVLVIALIVFGPKRLPEMGRSIGRGLREFRGAIMDDGTAPPARSAEPARPPAATTATVATAPAATAVATTEDDDILEGIVVPGDTPPTPEAPPSPPPAPDA